MAWPSLTVGALPRERARAFLISGAMASLLASGTPWFAADYFVDQGHLQASDDNAGTEEEAPWLTLVHAVETAAAGDTVWIKSGTYTESNHLYFDTAPAITPLNGGTAEAPIAFRVPPGEEVLLGTWVVLDLTDDYQIWDGFELADGQAFVIGGSPSDLNEGSVIENCEIHRGGELFGQGNPGNHYNILSNWTRNLHVRNCKLHDSFFTDSNHQNATGITLYNTFDALIEHNEFYGNNVGIYDKWAGNGNVFRFNSIHHNVLAGIMLTGFGSCDVVECGFQDISNNLISDSPLGMKLGIGPVNIHRDIEIWNNTIHNVDDGILLAITPGVRMWNNIVHAETTALVSLQDETAIAQSDFSVFYPATRFVMNFSGAEEVVYETLEAWSGATGLDAVSMNADPLFRDAPARDFRLQDDSPARDAGRLDGDPDADPQTIGAYVSGVEWIGPRSLDVNGDGILDGTELSWIGRAFGSCSAEATGEWWYPIDHNLDGCVDGEDLAFLSGVWSCQLPDFNCPER